MSVPPRAFSRTRTSHRRSLATRWRCGDSFGWDHPAQAKTHEIRISKHRVASSCGASALSPVRIGAECLRPGESCRRTPANAFAWHGRSDGETRRLRSLPTNAWRANHRCQIPDKPLPVLPTKSDHRGDLRPSSRHENQMLNSTSTFLGERCWARFFSYE